MLLFSSKNSGRRSQGNRARAARGNHLDAVATRPARPGSRVRNVKLRLRVARVMSLDAFREQALAPALPPARKGRPAAFGFHASTKTVLTFACSLGRLIGPFHKTEEAPVGLRAVTLEVSTALSIERVWSPATVLFGDCQRRRFLK